MDMLVQLPLRRLLYAGIKTLVKKLSIVWFTSLTLGECMLVQLLRLHQDPVLDNTGGSGPKADHNLTCS